jgi:RES domain-containing protein
VYVYRIHDRRFASLDGAGAAHFGGRWNPKGIPLLYTASSFEGALLEQLARAGVGRLPRHHVAAKIALPAHMVVPSLDDVDHPDWHLEPTSRRIGEGWVASASSLALVVPSFVARPWGRNVLINPAHPAFAGIQVSEVVDVTWDPRLA